MTGNAGHNRNLSDDITDDLKQYKVTFIHKKGEVSKQVSAKDREQAEERAWNKVDSMVDYDSVEIEELLP